MLLRGIAFGEARRSATRRVLKPQSATDKENNARKTTFSTNTDDLQRSPFTFSVDGEAISLVATASKLAAVEDAAPKGPEAPAIRPSSTLKVSPTARAALQALRSPRARLAAAAAAAASSASTSAPTPHPTTRDVETITGDQLADTLTKPLSAVKFVELRTGQGLE